MVIMGHSEAIYKKIHYRVNNRSFAIKEMDNLTYFSYFITILEGLKQEF